MGWHSTVLANLPFEWSEKFPALLTHRSGVDKKLLEWFRPLINFGVRAEQISRLILELQTKAYTKRYIEYEYKEKKTAFNATMAPQFSSFDDKLKYDGKVPSGHYLETVYIHYMETIKVFLDNEVKKRSTSVIKLDASYKISKRMMQTRGKSATRTLITGTNEFNEIRLQFFQRLMVTISTKDLLPCFMTPYIATDKMVRNSHSSIIREVTNRFFLISFQH